MIKMEAKSIIHVVGTKCPPETEAKFNTWYNETHVPHLLKFKKLKRVTRYKNLHPAGEYPEFLTIYEFDNRQGFEEYHDSPERTGSRESWLKIQEETGASLKWEVQFEAIKTWQR